MILLIENVRSSVTRSARTDEVKSEGFNPIVFTLFLLMIIRSVIHDERSIIDVANGSKFM